MGAFLDWFFAFLTTMIGGVVKIFSGIFGGIVQIFNIADYIAQLNDFKGGFGVIDWILAIFALLVVLAIWAVVIYMLVLLARKYIRFRKTAVASEDLLEEVAKLHRDVLRLTKEKERILALKIASVPVNGGGVLLGKGGDGDERKHHQQRQCKSERSFHCFHCFSPF